MKNTLNKLYFTAIAFLLCFCISGCKKDLGNYAYTELNEITFGSIEDNYTLSGGAKLSITPSFIMSNSAELKEDDYTFEWICMRKEVGNGESITRKLIAKTRNIDLVPSLSSGGYNFWYRVTEKATGSQWQKSFSVTIFSNFQKGWLVLSETNNSSRVDLLENKVAGALFVPTYDILNASGSQLKLEGKPSFLAAYDTRNLSGSNTRYVVYIGTDKGTNWVNSSTYNWTSSQTLANDFVAADKDFHADWIESAGNYFGVFTVYAGGNYYSANLFSQSYPGVVVNQFSAALGGRFVPARYAVVLPSTSPTGNVTALYDTEKRRFGLFKAAETSVSLPSGDSQIIDLKNTGKDLVFMGYTGASTGMASCVMKDPATGAYSLLNIQYARSVFNPLSMISMNNATDINKASLFTLDPQFTYLFYAVGGKLYQFNTVTGENKLAKDYGNKTISMLKYNRMLFSTGSALRLKLLVGLHDGQATGDSGQLELYTVSNLMQPLENYETYTGFGKIKDVIYIEK